MSLGFSVAEMSMNICFPLHDEGVHASADESQPPYLLLKAN